MLGSPARQVSGAAAWLAQLPSGAIVGINDYRLIGETAELADLHQQRGYLHGRWTCGQAHLGVRTGPVGGDAGDCHYAVIEQSDTPLRRQSVRGCRGVFTTPTVLSGNGLAGLADGALDMVWQRGALRLEGFVEVRANGQRGRLPIRHHQPAIGATLHGGSLFGGSAYTLIPVVAENGMLRCVILYRMLFESGAAYQGIAMFAGHMRFGTQNMYTKDCMNC